MKKRLILAVTMLLCLVLLTACQSSEPQRFNVKSANTGSTGGTANTQNQMQNSQTAANDDGYDPLAEEDSYEGDADYWGNMTAVPPAATATPAPTIRSEYAGATPVVIDPIDKPTPTPVPPLTFTYQTYDAVNIGLSFEGPTGWTTDDTNANTFIIQNPNAAMDYPATMTIRAEKVSSAYTNSQLKSVVEGMLDDIGSAGFDTYDQSSTASRTLLGKNGIYANYTGTLNDGRKIAGRVHAACVDKVLYTIHITYPYAYRDTYIDQVFHHLRDTIKITH
ncbi:MAG: hypothetical protein IJZ74_05300 [Clostridia bacterium]|nr:hypothetical protein [Clostridia bacterium]